MVGIVCANFACIRGVAPKTAGGALYLPAHFCQDLPVPPDFSDWRALEPDSWPDIEEPLTLFTHMSHFSSHFGSDYWDHQDVLGENSTVESWSSEFYEDVDGWADGEVPFEVVDDLGFDGGLIEEEGIGRGDRFELLARTLLEVAANEGASALALRCIRALLDERPMGVDLDEKAVDALVAGGFASRADGGVVRTTTCATLAAAWRDVLCGRTEEYGPCGATDLDEWSADLVARTLGATSRTESIRRELRRRGVAAFGMTAAA
jgi:hypothetical protein